jgi:hypothetical protein
MKKITFSILLIAIAVLFNSCGAARNVPPPPPESQIVTFNSEPQGARVVMNGQVIGTTPFMFPVPLTYHLARATVRVNQGHNVPSFLQESAELNQTRFTFIKDGYIIGEEIFQPTITTNPPRWGGIATHSFNYSDAVFHILAPQPIQAQTVVSRDAPGATSMERTIIRWRFDSDPRGARVSWRVISSIPDEVRNTNDTFLSTTPFEEPRGFDILGLTYENSHNVTIEIRVERRGFFEQVRRFNVRQALDQREISGFFELVPTD